jgi:hypothetical protein
MTARGFQQLKELIYSGRLRKLVVSEQSRLSRGDNVKVCACWLVGS